MSIKRFFVHLLLLNIPLMLLPIIGFAQLEKSVTDNFVKVEKNQLTRNGQPYYYIGANFWAGMNLGIEGNDPYRIRLVKELDRLQALGVSNLRIMAASEGPDSEPWRMVPALQPEVGKYNERLLKGLDFLLVEMKKRDMLAVVCLNNMWPWSGGFAQYINWVTGDPIPYPPPAENGKWLKYMQFSARFFKNEAAQAAYFDHIKVIINRTNSISNTSYKEDPTIMSWQLANEPRAIISHQKYRRWVERTAAFIKSLDAHHLVSIGSEGDAFLPFSQKFKKEHRLQHIDYATMHIWIQNWGWYDPKKAAISFPKALRKAKKYIHRHIKKAKKLGMPVVLEEFGIARDDESFELNSSTTYRDRYYTEVFDLIYQAAKRGEPIAGCNFWAWAGEGRPRHPKAVWKAGDDFIGDPPFEYQGWYSIYDTDESTLGVIREYAERIGLVGK